MGKPKGFAVTAARDPEAHRELARQGGKASHAAGTAHEFTSEEAREAGRKGGRAKGEAYARKRAETSGDVAPAVGSAHCADSQRGCWRPGQTACVCRCVRCGLSNEETKS